MPGSPSPLGVTPAWKPEREFEMKIYTGSLGFGSGSAGLLVLVLVMCVSPEVVSAQPRAGETVRTILSTGFAPEKLVLRQVSRILRRTIMVQTQRPQR